MPSFSARELNLGADDMHKLRWAALLHDVGKLTVPSEILNKDGRPDEGRVEAAAGSSSGLEVVPRTVASLARRLGSRRRPASLPLGRQGLSRRSGRNGHHDPPAAWFAIADAYDVMTSTRSYKKPLSPELARQELTACAGSQFDPHMVRAFLRVGLGRLRDRRRPSGLVGRI